MKIVDAVWEKRNLGVDTQEVTVEENDSLDQFKETVNGLSSQYQVIKIPTGKVEFMNFAMDNGFRFSETQITMTFLASNSKSKIDSILKRYPRITSVVDNSNDSFEYVSKKIDGLFHTDRIALDPFFSEEIANFRYKNWFMDYLEREDKYLLITKNKDEIIGFNLCSKNGSLLKGIVGGIFHEYQKMPLGLPWAASQLKEMMNCNFVYEIPVSSNNLPIVKLWQFFDIPITYMTYVFVKHI